jgi:hypothetical protein
VGSAVQVSIQGPVKPSVACISGEGTTLPEGPGVAQTALTSVYEPLPINPHPLTSSPAAKVPTKAPIRRPMPSSARPTPEPA